MDRLLRESDVIKKLQEKVGFPPKVWVALLTDWLREIPDADEWIPVNERLPEPNRRDGKVNHYYLVQNEYGDMAVACYRESVYGLSYWEQIFTLNIIDEIIAWRELPYVYYFDDCKECKI